MDESENVVQIYLQRRLKIQTEICVANLARRSVAKSSEEFFEATYEQSEYVGIKELRKSNICMKF